MIPPIHAGCIAHGARLKAWLFLLFPVNIVMMLVAIYFARGHSLGDYPGLLASGKLSLGAQLFALAGIAVWLRYLVGPARVVVANEPCLIEVRAADLWIAGRRAATLRDIDGARIDSAAMRRTLVVMLHDGATVTLPILFCREPGHLILAHLLARRDGQLCDGRPTTQPGERRAMVATHASR